MHGRIALHVAKYLAQRASKFMVAKSEASGKRYFPLCFEEPRDGWQRDGSLSIVFKASCQTGIASGISGLSTGTNLSRPTDGEENASYGCGQRMGSSSPYRLSACISTLRALPRGGVWLGDVTKNCPLTRAPTLPSVTGSARHSAVRATLSSTLACHSKKFGEKGCPKLQIWQKLLTVFDLVSQQISVFEHIGHHVTGYNG